MPPKRKAAFAHNPRKARRISTDEDAGDQAPPNLTDPSSLPPRAVEQARQNVSSKITSGNKTIFRALKKARGFEKQKLAKRLKAARDKKDGSAVQKLVLELEAVKNPDLDLAHLASTHILKTLLKSKQVSTSPLFPPSLIPAKDATTSSSNDENENARRNVIARLYNSVPVKEGMVAVMGSVRSAMGLEEGIAETRSKEKKLSGSNEEEVVPVEEDADMDDAQDQVLREAIAKDQQIKPSSPEDEEMLDTGDATSGEDPGSSEGSSEEEEDDGQDIWSKLESAPDDVFAGFDERLAGTSSSDEEESDAREGLPPDQIRTDDEWSGSEDEVADGTSSEDEEDKEDAEEEDDDEEEELSTTTSRQKAPTSNSTYFLPSLLSGYISGSSSDSGDDSSRKKTKKKKGPPEKAVRKNRMGQQARRALWEKKFGAAANHVKSEQEKKGRDAGRGEMRGGRGGRGRGSGRGATNRPSMGQQGEESNGGSERKPGESKKKAQEGPLHPSWEAMRKVKERQAATKPQGKKITFD